VILKCKCVECGLSLRVSARDLVRDRGWLVTEPPLNLPDIVVNSLCPRCAARRPTESVREQKEKR